MYNAHKRVTYNKFVSSLMRKGNRSAAENIARSCVARIKLKEEKESQSFFTFCVKKAKPLIHGISTNSPARKKTKIVPIPSHRGRRLAIQ